ncbi:MAG: hypothetical protein WA858_10295 [Xanthobacteraceae bacterium]|jgi:hypothetical protein
MVSRGKAEKKAARSERLSAALRENLKRRKAQARGRAESHDVEANESPSPANPGNERQSPDFRRNRSRD